MNWRPIQYQTMREIRRVIPLPNEHNRRELHRLRSAFGAGLLPQRVIYSENRLLVMPVGRHTTFCFSV